MNLGVDTSFLVRVSVVGCVGHAEAREFLRREIESGNHRLAIATPVYPEFLHIITDSRRFSNAATMPTAIAMARLWWESAEVERIEPTIAATDLLLEWMIRHNLGRKRLLDTQLAAIYVAAGIGWIVTSDKTHFDIFPGLRAVVPGESTLPMESSSP